MRSFQWKTSTMTWESHHPREWRRRHIRTKHDMTMIHGMKQREIAIGINGIRNNEYTWLDFTSSTFNKASGVRFLLSQQRWWWFQLVFRRWAVQVPWRYPQALCAGRSNICYYIYRIPQKHCWEDTYYKTFQKFACVHHQSKDSHDGADYVPEP